MAVFGDTLRQARAQKGVTLKEAEQATRINRHHLAALEEENFAVLPPLIYQRGIVRNYASYLGLDPGKLLATFEDARGGDTTVDLVAAVKPLDMPSHWAPNFAIIAFMVVMSAIVFAWAYSAYFAPAEVTSTVPPAIPTVTPIPESQLVAPSPTAPPASPIPSATSTARPTETQSLATSTPQPRAPTPTQPLVSAPATETIQTQVEPPPPEPPASQGETATIRVIAQGDIAVTIVADDQVVVSGWLPAGTATEWYTAATFAVTTSDGSLTLFENAATGAQFYMGYGPDETYYLGA
jgi:cytoskeleton protein RodZ